MEPQLYGWQHILYLVISLLITFLALFFGKKYIKDEKKETIFIKTIAVLLLLAVLFNRFSVAFVKEHNWKYIIPNTFCGMTSLAFSISTLIGKKGNKTFHCLWYLAITGGVVSVFYPDFLDQDLSFMYLPTISGLLHHSFLILLSIALLLFGWFKPSLKESYIFTIGVSLYIVFGYIEIYVIGFEGAMDILSPLLSGTPLDCYFILGVGTLLIILFNLLLIGIQKLKDKKAMQNESK